MSSKAVYEKFTYTDENRVGYAELAHAIIMQAINDYRIAILRLRDETFNTSDYSKPKCLIYINEVPRFLKSQEFMKLSDLDGEALLEYIDKYVKEECGVE